MGLVAEWRAARAQGATAYTPSNLDARPIGYSNTGPADGGGLPIHGHPAGPALAGVNPVLVSAAMGSSSNATWSTTNQADHRGALLDDVLDSYLQAIEGRLSENDVTFAASTSNSTGTNSPGYP